MIKLLIIIALSVGLLFPLQSSLQSNEASPNIPLSWNIWCNSPYADNFDFVMAWVCYFDIEQMHDDIKTLKSTIESQNEKIEDLQDQIDKYHTSPTHYIDSDFTGKLDGWETYSHTGKYALNDRYSGKENNNYKLTTSQDNVHISGDGFMAHYGIKNTISKDDIDQSKPFYISFDYKATSGTYLSSVTNAVYTITDSSDNILHHEFVFRGGSTDSGWTSYKSDNLIEKIKEKDITIKLYLNDSWFANWNQHTYFDNVKVSDKVPELTYSTQSQSITIPTPDGLPSVIQNSTSVPSTPEINIPSFR